MTKYRKLIKPSAWDLKKNPEAKPYWQYGEMETERFKRHNTQWPDEPLEPLETYDYRAPHVFVSVEKKESYYYNGEARANFELYNKEYINLTYLNSVWLEWVITNKKLGDWQVGGKVVDYAYAIRYLKTAIDYIRKREKDEKDVLDTVDAEICKDPEWPLRLSEWKLRTGVRRITEYQAKRFAKAVTWKRGKNNPSAE